MVEEINPNIFTAKKNNLRINYMTNSFSFFPDYCIIMLLNMSKTEA